jgi:predicted transcriptional regulator
MTEIDELISKVRTEAAARNLRPATLARMAGLSANTLRNMDDPDWDPRSETLRRILEALGERPEASQSDAAA